MARQRGPEVAAGMLMRQHDDVGEGLVRDHGEQPDQAEDREHLQRRLEQAATPLRAARVKG